MNYDKIMFTTQVVSWYLEINSRKRNVKCIPYEVDLAL